MHCLAFSISLNTVGAVIELSILLYCNFTKKLSRFQFSNTRFLDLSIYISNQTLFPLDLHFLPPPDPNFSNPRLFETPQTRTNCGPVGKFTLDYFNLSKFWNHFVPILVTYASIIYTKVRTMNISKIIDQSFSVSMWQQVITHFVR